MLRGEFEDAGDRDPAALRAAYESVLADRAAAAGPDTVAAETGIDEAVLQDLVAGESPSLTLADAAAILATDPDRPDADAIAAEARDLLLMGMSTAVLDVDAIKSGIGGRMEAKEIQQKVEGRRAMTLEEYAILHQFIEGRT